MLIVRNKLQKVLVRSDVYEKESVVLVADAVFACDSLAQRRLSRNHEIESQRALS